MSKEWKPLRPSLPSSQDSSGLRGDSSPGLSSSKRLSKSNIDISAPNEGHSQSRPPLSRKQSDSYDGDSSTAGQRCFFSRWGEIHGCGHTWSQEKMEKSADKFRGADSPKNSQEQHGGKGREATNTPTANTRKMILKNIWKATPQKLANRSSLTQLHPNLQALQKQPWKGFAAGLQRPALSLPDYK